MLKWESRTIPTKALRLGLFAAVLLAAFAITSDVGASHKKSHYTYKFVNPFPFPVKIKVYGPGKYGFPDVHKMPAPPAPPIPVPFPNLSMKIKVKINGKWSSKYTIPWKSGAITLPGS